MARPHKRGLEYFSLDTDASSSREVEYLEAVHGLVGYSVFIKLLERIYGHEGYFIRWTEMDQAIFAKRCCMDVSQVKAIIETCFDANLFCRWVFEANQVLTSTGIQRRYVKATERRGNTTLNKKYDPQNYQNDTPEKRGEVPECGEEDTPFSRKDDPSGFLPTITPPEPDTPPAKTPQRKVKESKGKKTITVTSPPEGVSVKVWEAFKVHRKAKRAPITEIVIDGFRREATKAQITLEDSFRECCERGWQGFKAEWYLRDQGKIAPPSKAGAAHLAMEEVERRFREQAELDRRNSDGWPEEIGSTRPSLLPPGGKS